MSMTRVTIMSVMGFPLKVNKSGKVYLYCTIYHQHIFTGSNFALVIRTSPPLLTAHAWYNDIMILPSKLLTLNNSSLIASALPMLVDTLLDYPLKVPGLILLFIYHAHFFYCNIS
jgi:hypothetical protein